MKNELVMTIIAIMIGSVIASIIDFILLEDLRLQKRLQYERMMVYGNL